MDLTDFSPVPEGQPKYGINDRAYDARPRFSVKLGRTQEWVITNTGRRQERPPRTYPGSGKPAGAFVGAGAAPTGFSAALAFGDVAPLDLGARPQPHEAKKAASRSHGGDGEGAAAADEFGESHAFHMHTNHFRVVGVSPATPLITVGDVLDTVLVPLRGNVTIRFTPLHFAGQTLLHCHQLTHQAAGMAMRFDIVP